MSQRSRRLVVHIGGIKTGSTAIQTALARRAITVPGEDWSYARLPYTLDHGYLASIAERIDEDRRTLAKTAIGAVGQALTLNRSRTVIVSAEHFSNIGVKRLRSTVKALGRSFGETEVVIYVRPHIGSLNALLAELLKQGKFAGTYDDFIPPHIGGVNYVRRIGTLKRVLGLPLHVRPFVRSEMADSSVVADFASVVFPDTPVEIGPARDRNSAPSLRDLMRLKVMHGELIDMNFTNRFYLSWALAEQIARNAPADQRKLTMPRPIAEYIFDERIEDARAFDKQFLAGNPVMTEALERERDACTDPEMSLDPSDCLDADEINTLRSLARTMAASWGKTPAWHVRLYLSYVRQMMSA